MDNTHQGPNDAHAAHAHHKHPPYVLIGIILAVLTAIEVGVTFLPIGQGLIIGALVLLMLAKGALVVLYFMHLKFDSPLFMLLFAFPLFLLAIPMVLVFMVLLSSHPGIAG